MQKTENKTTWRKVKLGEVVTEKGSVSGPFGSNIHSKFYTQAGVPIIRGNNLTIGINGGRYVDDDYMYLSESKAEELSQSEALPDDIVVTARGTIGQTGIIPENSKYRKYILSANQLRFRINKKIASPLFVYYWLSSKPMVRTMQNISVNVGVPNFNLKNARELLIPLASLEEQRRIADILSAFDDKIELNNKVSRTLEQMAQAIFKEWFVNYRFPGYEETEFIDSELGKIPKGWHMGMLLNIAEIIMGQSPASENYNTKGDGLPFHQGVTNFGNRFPSHEIHCTQNERIAEINDILFSVRAPVGRINIANAKISLGRGVAAIREKQNRQSFLYYLLRYYFQREDVIGSGSVFPAVTKKELNEFRVLIPASNLIEKFEAIVRSIDEKIKETYYENKNLTYLRDLLLPKLMSGEIRV